MVRRSAMGMRPLAGNEGLMSYMTNASSARQARSQHQASTKPLGDTQLMDIAEIKTARREPPALLSILTLTLCAFALTTAEFVSAGILPEVAADMSVSIASAGHLVT